MITIISLDRDYEDCVKEMGGHIVPHDGVIDVTFHDGVSMFTSVNKTISFSNCRVNVGMVLDFSEFQRIYVD